MYFEINAEQIWTEKWWKPCAQQTRGKFNTSSWLGLLSMFGFIFSFRSPNLPWMWIADLVSTKLCDTQTRARRTHRSHSLQRTRCLYYFLLDYKSKRNNTIDDTAFSVAAAAANAQGRSGRALAPFLTTKHLLVMRWMPTPYLFYLQIWACTLSGVGLGVYGVWQHRCGI